MDCLKPMLETASLEYSANLWHVFIRPLCNVINPFLAFENDRTRKTHYIKEMKASFKTIVGLGSKTTSKLVIELAEYDFNNEY